MILSVDNETNEGLNGLCSFGNLVSLVVAVDSLNALTIKSAVELPLVDLAVTPQLLLEHADAAILTASTAESRLNHTSMERPSLENIPGKWPS